MNEDRPELDSYVESTHIPMETFPSNPDAVVPEITEPPPPVPPADEAAATTSVEPKEAPRPAPLTAVTKSPNLSSIQGCYDAAEQNAVIIVATEGEARLVRELEAKQFKGISVRVDPNCEGAPMWRATKEQAGRDRFG